MKSVFVVQHEYEWCGRDEVKFIGVYTTEVDAQAAVKRLTDQPGFCDWPDGFSVDKWNLGENSWDDGFSIIVNIFVPLKNAEGKFECVASVWQPGNLYKICNIHEDAADLKYSIDDVVECEEGLHPEYPDGLVAVRSATKKSE